MSVFNRLRAQQEDQQRDAYADYIRFLDGLNIQNASDDEAKRLQAYLSALGLTLADAEADHRQVQLARRYESEADDYDNRRDAMMEARDKRDEHRAETQRLHHERKDIHANLCHEHDRLESRFGQSKQARIQLKRMREDHAPILAALGLDG